MIGVHTDDTKPSHYLSETTEDIPVLQRVHIGDTTTVYTQYFDVVQNYLPLHSKQEKNGSFQACKQSNETNVVRSLQIAHSCMTCDYKVTPLLFSQCFTEYIPRILEGIYWQYQRITSIFRSIHYATEASQYCAIRYRRYTQYFQELYSDTRDILTSIEFILVIIVIPVFRLEVLQISPVIGDTPDCTVFFKVARIDTRHLLRNKYWMIPTLLNAFYKRTRH